MIFSAFGGTRRLTRLADRIGGAREVIESGLKDYVAAGSLQKRLRKLYSTGCINQWSLACHETSTHYKWLIDYSSQGSVLWLHEFKRNAGTRDSYASIPHNHRYAFTSFIIAGGYTHMHWSSCGNGLRGVQPEAEMRIDQHCAISVQPDQIHSLKQIEDGTITLVLQSPPQKTSSGSFHHDGQPRGQHDVHFNETSVVQQLIRRLPE